MQKCVPFGFYVNAIASAVSSPRADFMQLWPFDLKKLKPGKLFITWASHLRTNLASQICYLIRGSFSKFAMFTILSWTCAQTIFSYQIDVSTTRRFGVNRTSTRRTDGRPGYNGYCDLLWGWPRNKSDVDGVDALSEESSRPIGYYST